jgi:hypothetical protein
MAHLTLPDGTPESSPLLLSDIASAAIVFDAIGAPSILLVTRAGNMIFVASTQANIDYLASVGLTPAHVPAAVEVRRGMKP